MSALTPRMSGAIVCLLVLIVGVPATKIDLQCTARGHCAWLNDVFNRLHWTLADVGAVAGGNTGLCLVPQSVSSSSVGSDAGGQFVSPTVFSKVSGQMCLQFVYWTAGRAKLNLLKRSLGSCSQLKAVRHGDKKLRTSNCDNWELWTSAAANNAPGGNWFTQAVTIEPDTDFKLIFEGTIPANNPNARICVDNITAYHRPCHQIAASAYEASMRRWLEPMVFIFIGALAFALIIAVSIFAIRVNRRRSKKLSPGSSEDGSASPQRPNRQQHHRRQQEAMLLHAERLADGPASGSAAVGAVPIGHGHGPRRPAPPVPAEQPSLDELLSNGHRAAASATAPAAAAGHNDPPPRYEEAMGLVASAAAGSSSASDQLPPPHPPRLNRRNGGHVV